MENTIQEQDQFIRIAMARLQSVYKFKPQRFAVACKMYRQYSERKTSKNVLLSAQSMG